MRIDTAFKFKLSFAGSINDMLHNLKKLSFGAFYSIFRVIFRVSAGFVGLVGLVFGLWSALEFFVTACIGVRCAIV